jgi:SAM-dependent methyltransferase
MSDAPADLSRFDADWLALRAPADRRARANDLPVILRRALPDGRPLRVLDLGCGTGANLRELAPRLGGSQHWIGLDADPGHLARLLQETADWAGAIGCDWTSVESGFSRASPPLRVTIETHCLDLARSLDELPLAGVDLVTASALLDLVSAEWLGGLVARCARARVAMLMVLSIDGRILLDPVSRLDQEVCAAVTAHQARDKGFGPALGAAAAEELTRMATAHGYQVASRVSDWLIDDTEPALQVAVIEGWSEAAHAQAPAAASRIARWREERLAAVACGLSRMRVGHRDLLALPPCCSE